MIRSDLLDIDYINSLPQPLLARAVGDWYQVHDIDVETGLLRIYACGLLDVLHVGWVLWFRDACGKDHDSNDFYADPECWVDRTNSPIGGAS